jgi:adenine-specific DNA-methyltransferase
MVKLNWEGKIECKNNINLLNYNKAYQCDLIESIISPLNANLEKDAYLKNLNAKREGIDNKRENIWKNKLFWGDNSIILNFLLKDFQEKINLIYFDPPFGSGGDFDYIIQIGEGEAAKKASKWLRKRSYSDSWKEGLNSYFNFMYKRLLLMRKLLSPKGSIYIHLDWHISHYIKIILDEIFGVDNFRNEIIWAYPAASVQTRRFFMRSYDVILFYSKSEDYVFNDDPNIYMEYSNRVKNALKKDEKGVFYYRGGSHNGKKLSQKVYVKENGIFPRDVWKDIPYIRANTIEYQ